MKSNSYKKPMFDETNFHCPHCNVLSQQEWKIFLYSTHNHFSYAKCFNCSNFSIWKDKKMIYPPILTNPLPHKDMPENVKAIYNEARNIANLSSRAAAALLRVALEELTKNLGEKEGTLFKRIGNLKNKGLPEKIIKSLDIVRIFGNEIGAHVGVIDLKNEDNMEIVEKLFWLINYIVEKTINEPNEIEKMFMKIPENKKRK